MLRFCPTGKNTGIGTIVDNDSYVQIIATDANAEKALRFRFLLLLVKHYKLTGGPMILNNTVMVLHFRFDNIALAGHGIYPQNSQESSTDTGYPSMISEVEAVLETVIVDSGTERDYSWCAQHAK